MLAATRQGAVTMTELARHDERPKRCNGAAVLVSATALAQHLDCLRTYIRRLEAEGVLHRDGSGFPLDQNRVAYLRFLRRERRQSPRGEAEAEYQKQKSRLLALRIAKQERMVMLTSDHEAFIDEMVGLVLTKLGGWPTRVGGADLGIRRRAEAVLHELRTEIAETCLRLANEHGEPEDDA
jgi:hypothetical protein